MERKEFVFTTAQVNWYTATAMPQEISNWMFRNGRRAHIASLPMTMEHQHLL
jgi:hypothetical protein